MQATPPAGDAMTERKLFGGAETEEDAQAWYNVAAAAPKPVREGVSVGRFMKLPSWSEPAAAAAAAERAAPAGAAAAEADAPPPKKAKRAAGGFGDFSGW